MYNGINRCAYLREKKRPCNNFIQKKEGGLIFEGGPIFKILWWVVLCIYIDAAICVWITTQHTVKKVSFPRTSEPLSPRCYISYSFHREFGSTSPGQTYLKLMNNVIMATCLHELQGKLLMRNYCNLICWFSLCLGTTNMALIFISLNCAFHSVMDSWISS